jgi:hypothetical protein
MYNFLGTQLGLHNINSKVQAVYKNRLLDISERGGRKKSKNVWKYEVVIEDGITRTKSVGTARESAKMRGRWMATALSLVKYFVHRPTSSYIPSYTS